MSDARTAMRQRQKRRLLLALGITGSFFVVELIGGILSGSLALLADAAHLFMDGGALLMAYAAMRLAERGATRKHTFGLHRAEILAAFVNAQLLLVVSAYLLYEAYHRFHAGPEIDTGTMLIVALLGLGGSVAAAALLHGQHHGSLNLRAAYLEVLVDAASSVGVVLAAVLMPLTGWLWLDPAMTVVIALLILPRAISLLRESGHILLEGAPEHVDLDDLRSRILEVPGVEEIHDLHTWTLTSGLHSVSVHIRAAIESPRGQVLKQVQRVLREEAGIDHATVQVEWGDEIACEITRIH